MAPACMALLGAGNDPLRASFPGSPVTKHDVDVVVVGAGPAGSTAALVLARGGATVALVDKATFPRDKACGDLVGPRALAVLASLGLTPPGGRAVGEMIVIGPTGRRVLLPARAGTSYPGQAIAVTRRRFDEWLRREAIDAGAEPVDGRVASLLPDGGVVLDDGRRLNADVVVGADGATSGVATAAGLVDRQAVLWGFAARTYVVQDVDRPVIALWDEGRRRGFPGYGWIFPGEGGQANIGLGIGLKAARGGASRVAQQFDAFADHLRQCGLLDGPVPPHRLGGWLKMGMVGTVSARGRVLLVGDAAGLVNPLQGEGIAPAITSAASAARAVLAGPRSAAATYREALAGSPARHARATAPVHAASITGSAARVALLGRVLTAPGLGRAIAAPWSLLWNDLVDGAPAGATARTVRATLAAARLVGDRSAVGRRLRAELDSG